MRQVTSTEYDAAKAALAVYADYCKPYVQKNGWTCIPEDAPRAAHNGQELTSDAVNAHSTNIELYELQRDKPEKFIAYVTVSTVHSPVTTWTGEVIGMVTWRGPLHTNNFGGRWRAITVRSHWGCIYNGREYDSRQCVNFKRSSRT